METFRQEVEQGSFPQEQYSPYKMSAEEEKTFEELLAKVPFCERQSTSCSFANVQ